MVRRPRRRSNRVGIFQVTTPGAATCKGTRVNECSARIIMEMAENGIYGHSGLAYWIVTQQNTALGLRGYNSRSIIDANDLTAILMGDRSYVSDIANRLVGARIGGQSPYTC